MQLDGPMGSSVDMFVAHIDRATRWGPGTDRRKSNEEDVGDNTQGGGNGTGTERAET